ncbi:cupin domain-containing protein [Halalkalibacillus halophilus]|uniref:cupin domain-containing protein n=1 Tax=Halalkalibacillus halophilus TaxID=392827 RepID=UPI000419783D|nr:cupin domain-containing protein [Halalkalibacillus halophilus]
MQTLVPEVLIDKLQLEPHPEGGFYNVTHVSEQKIKNESSQTEDQERALFTSIYFLLRSEDRSHFHRLKSDELWYYHGGSSLTVHMIGLDGSYETKKVGMDVVNGEHPQVLVPKGTIFGSTVDDPETFSLVGCMVAPGFDFNDFELFSEKDLLETYPQHEKIIKYLTV